MLEASGTRHTEAQSRQVQADEERLAIKYGIGAHWLAGNRSENLTGGSRKNYHAVCCRQTGRARRLSSSSASMSNAFHAFLIVSTPA